VVAGVLVLARLSESSFGRVVKWAVAGGVISGGLGLLQAAGKSPFRLLGAWGRGNIVGLAGNPNELAMACVLLAPLLLLAGSRSGSWVRLIGAAVLVGGAVVTESRAALIALGLQAVVLLATLTRKRVPLKARWAAAMAVLVLLVAGSWVAWPRLRQTLLEDRAVVV